VRSLQMLIASSQVRYLVGLAFSLVSDGRLEVLLYRLQTERPKPQPLVLRLLILLRLISILLKILRGRWNDIVLGGGISALSAI